MDPIAEARELHRAGKLPEAIERYAAILAASPERPEIWYLRADAELRLGDLARDRKSVV